MAFRPVLTAVMTAGLLAAGAASAQTVFTTSSWVPPTHTLTTAQGAACWRRKAQDA
jgi:TRAP-type transport system periplasmic protein